jgi:hypothetical protein
MNFAERKLSFVSRQMLQLRVEQLSRRLDDSLKCLEEAQQVLTQLYLLGPDRSLELSDDFFVFPRATFPALDFQILALSTYSDRLRREIDSFPIPEFFSDFRQYFHTITHLAAASFDSLSQYCRIHPCEISLSRYIWNYDFQLAQRIDTFISSPASIGRDLVSFCKSLLPSPERMCDLERAIGVLFFTRIVFDRLYELHPEVVFPRHCEGAALSLRTMPIDWNSIPVAFHPIKLADMPMREFFLSEPSLANAASVLNGAMFVTSPLDALYFVYRSIFAIQEAGRSRGVEGPDLSPHRLLSFDTMFSLLIGVVLASDLPDFFQFSEVTCKFLPVDGLSNPFEYARVGMEALMFHYRNVLTRFQ